MPVLHKFACLAVLLCSALPLASCETTGPGAPALAAAPKPMTHSQAAMECWMGTEKVDAHMNIDKRADIVDRCIRDKMKGEPPPKS